MNAKRRPALPAYNIFSRKVQWIPEKKINSFADWPHNAASGYTIYILYRRYARRKSGRKIKTVREGTEPPDYQSFTAPLARVRSAATSYSILICLYSRRRSALYRCGTADGVSSDCIGATSFQVLIRLQTSLTCTSETRPFLLILVLNPDPYPKLYFCIGSTSFLFWLISFSKELSPLVTPPVRWSELFFLWFCLYYITVL